MTPRHATPATANKRGLRAMLQSGVGLATVGAVIAGVIAASTTWALWNADGVFADGERAAGDLRMQVLGASNWQRVSAPTDVLPRLDANRTDRVTTMPTETVRITTNVESFLRGNNLAAGFNATFDNPAALEGATIAISVYDGATRVAGPAPIGDPLPVSGLYGTAAGVTFTHTVVIYVTIDGPLVWTTYLIPTEGPTPGTTWPGGNLDLSLVQVREGTGFIAGGTP
jgi:alternate signal-mediated exported protein